MAGKLSRTKIDLPAGIGDEIKAFYEDDPQRLFKVREFRENLTRMRLKQIDEDAIEVAGEVDGAAIDDVVNYNLKMLKSIENHIQSLKRPGLLIKALSCIEYIRLNAHELKVLCVGPRTEIEFFDFMGEGFGAGNLTGLDLMSYSEFVDVGDMHKMPYANNTFDIVFVGWTLTYSKDIQRVADECRRVAKPGGYIAIGVESVGSPKKGKALYGYSLDDAMNLTATDQIVDLFEGHVHSVPFRHEPHRSKKDDIDMIMVVIELK